MQNLEKPSTSWVLHNNYLGKKSRDDMRKRILERTKIGEKRERRKDTNVHGMYQELEALNVVRVGSCKLLEKAILIQEKHSKVQMEVQMEVKKEKCRWKIGCRKDERRVCED